MGDTPAVPASITSKWMSDNLVEFALDGTQALRTTASLNAGNLTIGSNSELYGWDPGTAAWEKVNIVGGALSVALTGDEIELELSGLYNLTTNPTPDTIGLVASINGSLTGETALLTTTPAGGKNPLDINVTNSTLATTQSGLWSVGRTWNLSSITDSVASVQSGSWVVGVDNFPSIQAVSQSGIWNLNNISGTISLPTNAAQETGGHLASLDTQLAHLQFDGSSNLKTVIENFPATTTVAGTVAVSNFPSIQLVAQSGAWSTGRTWTLASGSDSITIQGGNSTAVKVDGSAVTQPVSGTFWQTTQPVSVASLPLPSGASTSANQSTANTTLSTIATNTTGLALESGGHLASVDTKLTISSYGLKVDGSAVTQPISAVSLPLPAGAATSANQSTEITALNTLATNQTNGSQKTEIVNGTNTVAVNSNGSLMVGGSSAVGTAPANYPVSVSGIDGGGLKRSFLTDTTGKPKVSIVSESSNTAVLTGDTFNIVGDTITINSTETMILCVENPTGSGKTVKFTNVIFNEDPSGANSWIKFRVYYNPTITSNGTLITPTSVVAGSGATSVTNTYVNPTVSATGTKVGVYSVATNTADAAVIKIDPYLVVPPGNTALLTGLAKANATPSLITISWFEE